MSHQQEPDSEDKQTAVVTEHTSDDGASDEQQQSSDEFDSRPDRWRTKWRTRPSRWVARVFEITNLIIGIGTFLAVVIAGLVAYLSWIAPETQNEMLRAAHVLERRAWVVPVEATVSPVPLQVPSSVLVKVSNNGRRRMSLAPSRTKTCSSRRIPRAGASLVASGALPRLNSTCPNASATMRQIRTNRRIDLPASPGLFPRLLYCCHYEPPTTNHQPPTTNHQPPTS